MNDSDPGTFATLEGTWDEVWQRLSRGVADRRAPARHPVLATVSPDGWPEARTVVLRAAARSDAVCEVHTDLRSGKVESLRATPRATLHVWEEKARFQMRLAAEVEIRTGEAVAEQWAQVPQGSRVAYGKEPPPGAALADALAYAITPGPEHFAVLHLRLVSVDTLHLGADHRRAQFDRADGWRGQWLSP